MRPRFASVGLLLAAVLLACSDEAKQELDDARRELVDVQKKLGEAGHEMKDVTKELAKAAKLSKKDLERDVREIVRAAREASQQVPRPAPAQPEPAPPAGRIRCEAGTCVVDRGLIEELEAQPHTLLQEGLVVPVSSPTPGLRLERLRKGGLGEQLGLRDGDVLIAVNDHAVDSIEDLVALPGNAQPREELVLTFERDGQPLRVAVRLSEPAPAPAPAPQ